MLMSINALIKYIKNSNALFFLLSSFLYLVILHMTIYMRYQGRMHTKELRYIMKHLKKFNAL